MEVQHNWFSYKICLAMQLESQQAEYERIEQKIDNLVNSN